MKLAIWQCAPLAPVDADQEAQKVERNLARLAHAARGAARQGAQLLVCPEMVVTGYHIGAAAVQRLAQPANGAWAQAIGAIARESRIAIAYGFPERAADGRVFNAAQCLDADGRAIGHYRKTHLYGGLDRSMFSASDEAATVFQFNGWRLALLICYDVEFPENVRRLALAGADLILVPTANMAEFDFVATHVVPVRAFESQVAVAYANCCGSEGSIAYGGLSCVAAPDGQTPARAGRTDTVLIAEIDRQQLDAARRAFPYLTDRRPDLYG